MEFIYTGEELGPDRMLELGVVSRVADAGESEAELTTLTECIAGDPMKAFTASKRSPRRPGDSIEAAIEHEVPAQAVIFEADDHTEGVASLTSRRELEFRRT